MGHTANGASGRGDRLNDVLAAYLEAVETGQAPDKREWQDRHPEFAAELDAFCDDFARIDQLVAPVRAADAPDSDASPAARPALGRLGDFHLLREIGRGGMGVVYEAEQVSLGRRVALKVLPYVGALDARQLQRFRNEAKAAASLRHDHIVQVHAIGCDHGVHYYAMEFIDGQTLAHYIHGLRPGGGRLPATGPATLDYAPAEPGVPTRPVAALSTERSDPRGKAFYRRAAELIAQAADALEHAHSLGIVHRDVKPGNLLLDQDGRVYVSDFGLARFGPDAALTISGDLLGTLRYMAPEQALARHGMVDHRADVYGLGCTLYELLTGRPAVDATDRAEMLRQIAFEEPVALRKLDKSMPVELETITFKALTKNPTERYATAGELAEDLRRWLGNQTIKAKPPTLRQKAAKWARRRQAVVWSAAVILLILTGSLGWLVRDWQTRRAIAEARVADALVAAEPKLRDGNPYDPELVSAAQKAQAQLASPLRESVRHQVEQLLADVKMLATFEEIRLGQAVVKDGRFDTGAAEPAYEAAFREYGIDVTALDVTEVAAQIRARMIATHLAAALDNWARAREKAARNDWKRLLEVAREVDPDSWRCAFREAWANGRKGDLEKLLASAPIQTLSPTTVGLLVGMFAREVGNTAKALEAVLREAQQRCPADFWINENLAMVLRVGLSPPRPGEAIGFSRAALALRPQSPGVHLNLGNALFNTGKYDEAMACFREAIRLQPDYAEAHSNLGQVLGQLGKLAEAEVALRKAIELRPSNANSHYGLGLVLHKRGSFAEAVAAYAKAIELKPDYANAHLNMGISLERQGKLAEAASAYRKAIELKHGFAAHFNLGNVLKNQGEFAEAVAAYRKAVEFEPRFALGHIYLGIALAQLGQPAEAEFAFRKAIALQADFPGAHANLGRVLRTLGNLPEAEIAYRKAVELKPGDANAYIRLGLVLTALDKLREAEAAYREAIRHAPADAEAHCSLAIVLIRQERFVEGLEERVRGHELGSRNPDWPYPSAEWVREAERLVELGPKLPMFLSRQTRPADATECWALAALCYHKELCVAALRFCDEALAAQPALADDVERGHGYRIASVAALAGCGLGQDAGKLTGEECTHLRQRALAQLRDDLKAWNRKLENDPGKARRHVSITMQDWQSDRYFVGVRGPDGLSRLPEAERREWQSLWHDVAALVARCEQSTDKDK